MNANNNHLASITSWYVVLSIYEWTGDNALQTAELVTLHPCTWYAF